VSTMEALDKLSLIAHDVEHNDVDLPWQSRQSHRAMAVSRNEVGITESNDDEQWKHSGQYPEQKQLLNGTEDQHWTLFRVPYPPRRYNVHG